MFKFLKMKLIFKFMNSHLKDLKKSQKKKKEKQIKYGFFISLKSLGVNQKTIFIGRINKNSEFEVF